MTTVRRPRVKHARERTYFADPCDYPVRRPACRAAPSPISLLTTFNNQTLRYAVGRLLQCGRKAGAPVYGILNKLIVLVRYVQQHSIFGLFRVSRRVSIFPYQTASIAVRTSFLLVPDEMLALCYRLGFRSRQTIVCSLSHIRFFVKRYVPCGAVYYTISFTSGTLLRRLFAHRATWQPVWLTLWTTHI